MKTYIREFESSTHLIDIVTNDFKNYRVNAREYNKDFSLKQRVRLGELTNDFMEGKGVYPNSEKPFSRLLKEVFEQDNVYSLNDFREIK